MRINTALFILFCLISQCLFSQNNSQSFRLLTFDDGLPDDWTHVIFEDSKGYIWFGTHNGLVKYDGTNYKIYQNIPEDSTSITGNIIMDLEEDADGNIWVGTLGGGLCKFNPLSEKFEYHFFTDSIKEFVNDKALTNNVRSLLFDSNNDLWIGSWDDGLLKFDISKNLFTQYIISEKFQNSEEAFRVNSVNNLIEDKSDPNILWIGSNEGLYKFDKAKGTFTSIPIYSSKKNYNVAVTSLEILNNDILLLGTWGSGMAEYNMVTEEKYYYPFNKKMWLSEKDLVHTNIVSNFELVEPNKYLISSSEGLFYFDIIEKTFTRLNIKNPFQKELLTSDAKYIFIDSKDRKWASIFSKGIVIFHNTSDLLNYYPLKMDLCSNSSVREVIDIEYNTIDSNYYALIGDCDNVYLKNKYNEKTSAIPIEGDVASLPHNSYTNIAKDSSGVFWVSSKNNAGKSLYVYDKDKNTFLPYESSLLQQVNIHNYSINGIYVDEENIIWLATSKGGVIKLDYQQNNITQYVTNVKNDHTLHNDIEVSHITKGKNGIIWLSTLEAGVFSLEPQKELFKHYGKINSKKGSLIEGRINACIEGYDGQIWVGTNSRGIQILDPKNDEFPRNLIEVGSGLSDNNIQDLIKDQSGNIWISNLKGLSGYDYSSKQLLTLGKEQGIEDIFLGNKALYSDSEGDIVIGQANGFYTFSPETLIKTEIEEPKVLFTDFKILGQSRIFEKDLNDLESVNLRPDENFFSINFVNLDYLRSKRTKVRYILEGFDRNWNESQGNAATYTNVEPGNYVFKVQSNNALGIYGEETIALNIIIPTPWYQQRWAYFLAILGIGYLIYALFQFQINRRLRMAETQRLRDMDELKTKLYTNITHEFRTPLTVILGMADQIKENPNQWADEGTGLIEKNARKLMNLVNQILDLRKIESGAMPVNMVAGNFVIFLNYIFQHFEKYAAVRKIGMHFLSDYDELNIYYDEEKIVNIISNLVSNALKFTPDGGNIYLQLSQDGKNKMSISVRDTGIGISDEHLPYIFNRFYQVDETVKKNNVGSGIGLAYVKELTELLKGKIEVKSQLNKGANFVITLPYEEAEKVEITMEMPIIPLDIPVSKETESHHASDNEGFIKEEIFPTVLVVEDNLDVVAYLKSCLQKEYQIYIANDGAEGIEKAIQLVPDIIVSDVMMPHKDGFELCETLKEDMRTSHIPIILLTAKASMESRISGLKKGADAYLTKPFNRLELLANMEQMVQLRKKLQLRFGSIEQIVRPKKVSTEIEDQFLVKIGNILDENLEDENFGIQELCRAMAVSRTQLHNKLKALTNKSTSIFIRSYRLQKARNLLSDTQMSISEIAYEVGFKDPSYFSRSFAEEFGESPSLMRKS